jgi:hypothetical protein
MTEHEHDTEQAPTAAADLAEQTTELPPASRAVATPEAWSLDDTDEVDSAPPRSRFVWAGLVTLVVLITGALIFLAATLFSSHRPKPVEPKAQPATTVPVAAPSPPPAVTVTETPPPTVTVTAEPPAPPPMSATDQQFLSGLPGSVPYPGPAYAIAHAHDTCDYRANHDEAAGANRVAATTVWTGIYANAFEDDAELNYCPQYLPAEY